MCDIGMALQALVPNLQRYARLLTRNADRADDLVQTCIVRALAKQHLWHMGTDLRAWSFTIMRNAFVSDVRRRAREQAGQTALPAVTAVMPNSDPELSYRLRELQNALEQLPKTQKELILRIGVQRMPYADVSGDLGIPLGTVRSRLARAREHLRELTDR